MAAPTFTGRDADSMARALEEKVGGEIQVRVRVVPDIALTARGKLRRLIQEIPSDPVGEAPGRSPDAETPV
jgi:predicted RecB family endonuclease